MQLPKISIIACLSLMIVGCGGLSQKEKTELDSLRNVVSEQQSELVNVHGFLDVINQSMDSVILADGNIILKRDGEMPTTRVQVQERLDAYNSILNRQRQRIAELEQQLTKTKGENASRMKEIIAKLNAQIEEKEAEIAELKKQLNEKDVNIANLNKQVTSLSDNVSQLTEVNKEQEEALTVQSDMMNEAYYIVATKKELKKLGLLVGGALRRKKLNMSNVDTNQFTKIDIRKVSSIKIPGSSPKILTQAPAGSYEISKEGKESVLTITDATRFWSISNYLVIQY